MIHSACLGFSVGNICAGGAQVRARLYGTSPAEWGLGLLTQAPCLALTVAQNDLLLKPGIEKLGQSYESE